MKKFSRRKFLRAAAAGLGAAALSACGPAAETPAPPAPAAAQVVPPTGIPVPTFTSVVIPPTQQAAASPTGAEAAGVIEAAPSATAPAATAVPAATTAPAIAPDLVVARGGEPEDLVRRAVAALGGMEKFVPKGAKVVVKPNICTSYMTYEYAATTNPWVVAALVKLCLEAGASKVQVLDYPFSGNMMEAYTNSGISDAVKEAGGEMTPMVGYQYVEVEIPNGASLKKTKAYKDVIEADVLINVPIAKHHSSTRLTLGMKNLMGIIQNRNAIHQDLWHRIPDLARLFQPKLTVVDAVRILTAHGPSGGNLDDVKKLDTIIASADIVAADAYATTLFNIQPKDIPYIPVAAESGLGRMDLEALKIVEV